MITIDFSRFELPPHASILDVGCGSGRHVGAGYQQPRTQVVGIDPNHSDLLAAVERMDIHDRMHAHGGGAWHLAAGDARQHIIDDRRAMAELVRVTKPGGMIAISVPRFWPEAICWRLSKTYAAASGGHVRIYRTRQLIAQLQQAGLPAPRFRHWAHALHTPYWWLKCLLDSQPDAHWLVRGYHRVLVWDMMKKPRLTRLLEKLLNPVMGKSVVLYFRKPIDVSFGTHS